MKKDFKHKNYLPPEETDIGGVEEMIGRMQEQLNLLDKKIDTLIARSPERSFNSEHQKPFRRFDQSHHRGGRRQDNDFRERVLHKVICADCNKECEVPFRPSQDRPVYCKDCFAKRKGGGGGSFSERRDDRHREPRSEEKDYSDKPRGHGKKKFFEKRRPSSKKRKSRN